MGTSWLREIIKWRLQQSESLIFPKVDYASNQKKTLKLGMNFELKIPTIMHLESNLLACEVTRSIFREDPRYYINTGTAQDKSYYEIGLKFKNPNTNYLQQLLDLALDKKI